MNRRIITAAIVSISLSWALSVTHGQAGQTGKAAGPPALPPLATLSGLPFLPVDDLKAGMKGVGRTVFDGVSIAEFQAEILGVLKNYGPRQDLILARLSGGPLDKTGVIQGMSGSPVYVNGRLIGAVAYAFSFSKEPIAGIQPIEQMVGLLKPAAPNTPASGRAAVAPFGPASAGFAAVESPAAFVERLLVRAGSSASPADVLVPENSAAFMNAPSSSASLARIQTPLYLSGVSPAAIRTFAPFFSAFGFNPVQSGGSGSAVGASTDVVQRLVPGSPVSAELARGDISVSVNGTVTYVDGDKVYAFGHPYLAAGSSSIPMSTARIVSILAKLDNSMKIAVPLNVVGAFTDDRSTGIAGMMGARASMIPAELRVQSGKDAPVRYKFEVVRDKLLTPALMNMAVFSAITATEREIGDLTLNVTGEMLLKGSDPIRIANVFSSDASGPTLTSIAAVAPLQYLMASGFDYAGIERIDLEIAVTEKKASVTLDRISIDKNEVKPGEDVNVTAYLRNTVGGGITAERHTLQIPLQAPHGPVQLMMGDGQSITSAELRRGATGAPRDLASAVRELNKLRRNDRLYVKLLSSDSGVVIGGEEMPSLPPSMLATLSTDRTSTRAVASTASSTVKEYVLPPSAFVIQGLRTLTLTVKP